jgi:hypothetical protein
VQRENSLLSVQGFLFLPSLGFWGMNCRQNKRCNSNGVSRARIRFGLYFPVMPFIAVAGQKQTSPPTSQVDLPGGFGKLFIARLRGRMIPFDMGDLLLVPHTG